MTRTLNILKNDFKAMTMKDDTIRVPDNSFPSHCDIVILGGGAMGTSIAYWLKEKTGVNGLNVVVVEKDPTVSKLCMYIFICSNNTNYIYTL